METDTFILRSDNRRDIIMNVNNGKSRYEQHLRKVHQEKLDELNDLLPEYKALGDRITKLRNLIDILSPDKWDIEEQPPTRGYGLGGTDLT